MIFEVNKKEFIRAMGPAIEVASTNTLKDFKYENLVTIKAEEHQVVLLAFGGNLSLISPISSKNFGSIDYKCEEEGQTTVYSADLWKYCNALPDNYDKIKIHLESNELKLSLASDSVKGKKGNTQRTMETLSEIVRPPNLGETFDQDIEINREIFVNGIDSVIFAPAYEEKQFSYMCMLFEVSAPTDTKQEVKFSAGTGGRFAIKSVNGDKIINNNSDARMIFPKDSLSTISKLLSNAQQGYVNVKSIGVDKGNGIAEHIMIEFDGMILCIFGLDHFTKYPDLSKIINHKYSNRVFSSLKDWKSIEKTIDASRNRWGDSIHNTEINVDIDESIIQVTPKIPGANPTFIDMDDKDCVVKGEKVWFRCNSDYLREMVVQGSGKGKVQFNFESQEVLKDIKDEKQAQKAMKPILVKFEEDVDKARNTVDNFYMFFSVSNK